MRRETPLYRSILLFLTLILALGSLPALAQDSTPEATPATVETVVATPSDEPPVASPAGSPAASPVAVESGTVDLDVLFIGAHPDDEAFALAAYGEWHETTGAQVGVITITRGEGGGNAVGTEEGPALGLLREDEERRAVSVAGIEHIYNLDKVDFYYNVSAELTSETWGYDDTLEQVIRVVRATKPEVIVTMNPAPTPGNHGHHQLAARLAVDAYLSADNTDVFPAQLADEGLSPWRASRIFRSGFSGESQTGPTCGETFVPADPTSTVFGVWQGTESQVDGRTWAAIALDGQRTYASQGWAVFPDAPTNPDEIRCTFFTLIDSRTPIDASNTASTAALEGAVLQAEGGLPLGSELYITTGSFGVTPGAAFDATVHVRLVDGSTDATVELVAPEGWDVSEATQGEAEGETTWTYSVTPPADAPVNERALLEATLTSNGATGMTTEPVSVEAGVTGTLQPLQEVAYFREWVQQVDMPSLDNLIFPVFSMGSGEAKEITVDLTNQSEAAASGTVELALPAGFEAEPASAEFTDLAAGGTDSVTFTVTNSDATLATSNEGGEMGNYPFSITTTTDAGSSTQDAGINLVPTAVVPRAEMAPAVDGQVAEGEYTGDALNLSRVWEGQPVDSQLDGSGFAYVTYDDNGIYIAVEVVDDTLGTVLPENDAKRHWRTDSVEIAIDPLGTAGNTSATFKVGVFPTTEEGEPAAYRDADAHQGPIADTAPGMEVASTVYEPYSGYTLEVFIPFDVLPADIDPENAAMNIFIYDSDTQDLTGQTRLGWSTWQGVQGDPYRWGKVTFGAPGGSATPVATPAVDATLDAPIMPLDAAQSVTSWQSIRQSANDGVGLGGHPKVPEGEGVTVDSVEVVDDLVVVTLNAANAGDVYVAYVVDGALSGEMSQTLAAGDAVEVAFPDAGEGEVLISFIDEHGHVQAIAEDVTP